MDHYMKIAGDYFEEFEGWHLYPSLKNIYVLSAALAGICWLLSLWWISKSLPKFTFLTWEIISLLASQVVWMHALEKIQALKKEKTLSIANAKYQCSFQGADECRAFALGRVLRIDQSKFLVVAKKCKELLDLRQAFRSRPEADLSFIARVFYEPDSKGRLIAIVLAAISFLAALILRSAPAEPGIFELFADKAFQGFLILLLGGAATLYFFWVGLVFAGQFFFEGATMWILKTGIDKGKNLTALQYFVRDLVRFHRHENADKELMTIAPVDQKNIGCTAEKENSVVQLEDPRKVPPLEATPVLEIRDENSSVRPPT
jgi:hypothetical protein